MSLIDPNEYFKNYYYNVEESELRRIHDHNPPSEGLVRFFNQLEEFVFSIWCVEGELGSELHLLYAEHIKDFFSLALPIPIEDYHLANNVTVVFARRICDFNPNKDFFKVFNTLQHHRQTALETLGYLTIDPSTSPIGTFISAGQKIIPIHKLDRVKYLNDIYGNTIDKPHLDPKNKVYLMVDNTTGLIKIGHSKDPQYREGTLQSKQPETYLFAHWTAPRSVENDLHRKYAKLRIRGEWFRLSLKELDEIKIFMDNL